MEIGSFRNISVRFALVLSLGCTALTFGCAREEEAVSEEGYKPLPDQVISDFSITETSMGRKDWTMTALKAYVYESRNVLEAEAVKVTFFNENGDVRSVLRADHGNLNRVSDDMQARGNVVVEGSDGVVLETESLRWQSSTRQIVSGDSVKIVRDEDVLTGWGFRGDPDLGSFEILRNMKATIRARDNMIEGS